MPRTILHVCKFILTFCLLTLLVPTSLKAQQERFLTSDGVPLYLNVKGHGTPCLYIHGGPGSGSYWMEKFAGEMLESRFRMIYVDLRGVGRSGSPENGDYSMERMIADFEEIRKHLGYDQWMLMGHSFSGTLLTGYALEEPDSLLGMMMFNATLNLEESIMASWIPKSMEFLEIKDRSFYESDTVSLHDKLNRLFSLLNEKDLSWKLAYSSKEQETRMNATFSEIPNWNGAFSGIGLSHPDYLRNFKPSTGAVKVPVLYFYGTRDWTIGPEHYQGLRFPNLLLYAAEVGHVPFMDDNSEVSLAIDAFRERYPQAFVSLYAPSPAVKSSP